jgi:hypothetical protein
MLAPARHHRHAAVVGKLLEALLPGQHILDGHQIVGVLLGLLAHVDHGERHHELAGDDLLHRDAVLGKMNRRIEMRAGVLDDPPPVQIEAVLLEVVLLLISMPGTPKKVGNSGDIVWVRSTTPLN